MNDVPRSLALYATALRPLGWTEIGSYNSATGPAGVPDLYGLADQVYDSGFAVGSSIWLRQRQPGETGPYVGFVADNQAEVDAAYVAAVEAGGISEGEPAIRSYFGPNYYAANIGDFDGNHIEIVHKAFNPPSRPPALRPVAPAELDSLLAFCRTSGAVAQVNGNGGCIEAVITSGNAPSPLGSPTEDPVEIGNVSEFRVGSYSALIGPNSINHTENVVVQYPDLADPTNADIHYDLIVTATGMSESQLRSAIQTHAPQLGSSGPRVPCSGNCG